MRVLRAKGELPREKVLPTILGTCHAMSSNSHGSFRLKSDTFLSIVMQNRCATPGADMGHAAGRSNGWRN